VTFKVGDKIQHKLNKEFLFVLDINEDGGITCRTKNTLDVKVFYEWELEHITPL
jgi:hypothetical protein